MVCPAPLARVQGQAGSCEQGCQGLLGNFVQELWKVPEAAEETGGKGTSSVTSGFSCLLGWGLGGREGQFVPMWLVGTVDPAMWFCGLPAPHLFPYTVGGQVSGLGGRSPSWWGRHGYCDCSCTERATLADLVFFTFF